MKILNDNKLLLKIFSTLIAVVLWFAVTYTEDPSINQHIGNLDKVFTGESVLAEKGLIIVNKDDLQSLSVTVRGRRSKVIAALDQVVASVDVSRITEPGTHEVPVDYLYPPEMVMLTKARHQTIAVTAEKLVTKNIPIKIKTTQSKKLKDHIVELECGIESLKVTGAQSYVNKITYALIEIDESSITADGTTNYAYSLYDKEGKIWDFEYITGKSHSSIPVSHRIHSKAELPVKIVLDDSLTDDYSLTVKKQSVSTLTVGSIDGELPEALYAVITKDLLDVHGSVTIDISIPDNIYVQGDKTAVSVEFEIEQMHSYTLNVPITLENVPEGREVTIEPKDVSVRVRCAKNDAKAENLKAVADVSDLEEGVPTSVVLDVTTDKNIDILNVYGAYAVMH